VPRSRSGLRAPSPPAGPRPAWRTLRVLRERRAPPLSMHSVPVRLVEPAASCVVVVQRLLAVGIRGPSRRVAARAPARARATPRCPGPGPRAAPAAARPSPHSVHTHARPEEAGLLTTHKHQGTPARTDERSVSALHPRMAGEPRLLAAEPIGRAWRSNLICPVRGRQEDCCACNTGDFRVLAGDGACRRPWRRAGGGAGHDDEATAPRT